MSFAELLDSYAPPMQGQTIQAEVIGVYEDALEVSPLEPFKYDVIRIPRTETRADHELGEVVRVELHEVETEHGPTGSIIEAELHRLIAAQEPTRVRIEYLLRTKASLGRQKVIGAKGRWYNSPAFIPRRLLDLPPERYEELPGRDLSVVILRREEQGLLCSHVDVAVAERIGPVTIPEEGETVRGVVRVCLRTGVVVALGNGLVGYVANRDLDHGYIKDPREFVSVGQVIDARVVEFHSRDRQLTLSRKAVLPNPWKRFARYEGEVIAGRVVRQAGSGYLIRPIDEPAVMGLSPASDWPYVPHEGEEVTVHVQRVKASAERVWFSGPVNAFAPTG